MSDNTRHLSAILALSALALSAPAPASAAESHPCARVAVAAERLSCYDRAFPPAPEVNEAAARKAVEDFGLDQAPAPLRNPGQDVAEVDPDRVVGRVASVDYGSRGNRRIALDGGQVWTLTESSSSGPLKAGDEVVVRKGLMGGYLLTTPGGVTLRVRRTR